MGIKLRLCCALEAWTKSCDVGSLAWHLSVPCFGALWSFLDPSLALLDESWGALAQFVRPFLWDVTQNSLVPCPQQGLGLECLTHSILILETNTLLRFIFPCVYIFFLFKKNSHLHTLQPHDNPPFSSSSSFSPSRLPPLQVTGSLSAGSHTGSLRLAELSPNRRR